MLDFLKRKKRVVPPDIGKEDISKLDENRNNSSNGSNNILNLPEEPNVNNLSKINTPNFSATFSEIEKINAKIDSIIEWMNQFYISFSSIRESIGELRAMNLSNEKRIVESMKDANRVIDIFNEIRPEKLEEEYQKLWVKIKTIEEKITMNRQFMEDLLKSVKEIKRNADAFIGVENLLKFNEEVKKDLINVQKLGSKSKMYADKCESIFIELKDEFAKREKIEGLVSELNSNYSDLKKEIEKLQLNKMNLMKKSDFSDFKKTTNSRMTRIENSMKGILNVKKKLDKMEDLVEMAISISKKNEEEIVDLSMKSGNGNNKKLNDYKRELSKILGIIDNLVDRVNRIDAIHKKNLKVSKN